MKLAFVSLFFMTSAFAFETEFEITNTHFEINRAKEEVLREAEESCRIREIQGTVKQVSDWKVMVIPEQDLSADPRCHWRGSCFIPAQVNVTAQFSCKLE